MRADAVLLIAFGGPTRPEDIWPFLANVLRGRPAPPERVEEVVRHYEWIGGRSPLNALTFRQAEGLRAALAAAGAPLPVHVGMRNWAPYILMGLGYQESEEEFDRFPDPNSPGERKEGNVAAKVGVGIQSALAGKRAAIRTELAYRADFDDTSVVPYFMLPALGGGSTLRGYPDFRFRDRNRLLMNAELRWTPARFLDMAVFYDTGKVAALREDLNFRDLNHSYGIGMRIVGLDGYAFRIELAHSREHAARLLIGASSTF